MKIIKTYVLGRYCYGKPDYGEIRTWDDDKVVYICDYGVPLHICAKRCAEYNGWKFKRMYYSKKWHTMVLEFEVP